jgi:hypothetical protein
LKKGATSDDFHLRIAQIEPEFSFDDTSKLIDFVRKVKVLVEHYGKHRISAQDEQLAVKTFMRKWSRQIQANFNAFNGVQSVSTLDQFLRQVNRWTHSARAVRSQAETVGYGVTATKVTSHCPGSVKFSKDDDISSHENRNKKREYSGGGGRGQRNLWWGFFSTEFFPVTACFY